MVTRIAASPKAAIRKLKASELSVRPARIAPSPGGSLSAPVVRSSSSSAQR